MLTLVINFLSSPEKKRKQKISTNIESNTVIIGISEHLPENKLKPVKEGQPIIDVT